MRTGCKLKYLARLEAMSESRLAKQLHLEDMERPPEQQSEFLKEAQRLYRKYDISSVVIKEDLGIWGSWAVRVYEAFTQEWSEAKQEWKERERSTGQIYWYKVEPYVDRCWRGDKVSKLIARARAGVFPCGMRDLMCERGEPHCLSCGDEEESLEHILLECAGYLDLRRTLIYKVKEAWGQTRTDCKAHTLVDAFAQADQSGKAAFLLGLGHKSMYGKKQVRIPHARHIREFFTKAMARREKAIKEAKRRRQNYR